jgi:hypothetical protein
LSNKNRFDEYVKPAYSALDSIDIGDREDLSKELMLFMEKNPEFLQNKAYLQCLCYCFEHYVNIDYNSRYLPIQEKIKLAGEMAINFLRIFQEPRS